MRLSGSTALITGAGSGIGRGTALHAAAQGMHVIALDVKQADDTTDAIRAAGGSATAVSMDVRKPGQWAIVVEQALAAHGRIDLLANVAGVVSLDPDEAAVQTDEGWTASSRSTRPGRSSACAPSYRP